LSFWIAASLSFLLSRHALPHENIRARNPEAWDGYKRLNKLGGGRVPQARSQREQAGGEYPTAATSMRTPPSRKPQWTGNHASVTPTTPARTPEQMNEAATIKQHIIEQIAKRMYLDQREVARLLRSRTY
jgi:hypothetical protein